MKKMFSKQQQKAIKKELGRGYANSIRKQLIQRNILNTESVPFSEASVRSFLNGRNMKELVYKEILNIYKKTKTKRIHFYKKAQLTFKK